jgi:uncharacterized RDD family membrane protein YckC
MIKPVETRDNAAIKEGFRYASFIQRASATILDSSITLPIQIFIAYLMFGSGLHMLFFPFLLLIPAAYKICFEYYYGGTLGKIWLRMKIVNLEQEDISFAQALNRYAIYFAYDFALLFAGYQLFIGGGEACEEMIDLITFQCFESDVTVWMSTLVFVSMIWVGFDRQYQAFHDKIAKTIVLKEKGKPVFENYVIAAIIGLIIIAVWMMTQVYPDLMN